MGVRNVMKDAGMFCQLSNCVLLGEEDIAIEGGIMNIRSQVGIVSCVIRTTR